MRLIVLSILFTITVKTFAQKDSSEKSIPVFYKSDPAIFSKGIMEIPEGSLNAEPSVGNLIPVKIIDTTESVAPKIGLVNRKGKFIVPAELDAIGEMSGKYIVIYKQSKAGLIDHEGKSLIDTKYKSISIINNDSVKVKNFSAWKVRDASNTLIAEYNADSIKPSGPREYDLYMNGKIEPIIHSEWNKSVNQNTGQIQALLAVPKTSFRFIKDKNKTGVENLECNIMIAPVFDSVRYISSDSIFMAYFKKKIAIMDKDGSELLPLTEKFQKIFEFTNGRAKILKEGRYGFIDRIGNVHISPQYPDAHNFSENAVAVVIAGKWGFLDKDENIIVQPFYQEVREFMYGTARVKEKNKWFFVNKEGKKITTSPYDEILPSGHKRWLLVTKGKFGLADTLGKEMLAPKYENLVDLNNGYVIVKKLNKWGVVDYKQNFLLSFEFDGLTYDSYNNYFLTAVNGKEELISLGKDRKKGKGKQ
jgi:hypothetical protein